MPTGSLRAHRAAGLALLALLAACVPAPKAPPPQPVAPPPAPTPAPAPTPVAPILGWDVAPVEPGNWTYRREGSDSVASFGASPAAPLVTLRCRKASRQMVLSLTGVAGPARALAIRTSNGNLQWQAAPDASGLAVTRPATDTGLDWIAFSRGRISIEPAGAARRVLPVWAEIARVIEDCRS